MTEFLEKKLYADVEGACSSRSTAIMLSCLLCFEHKHVRSAGTCSGEFGYIIAVINVIDIGKGMVLVGSGQAEFITRYRAIVYKPFKGEVVDAVVNNVNKVRAPCTVDAEVFAGGVQAW